MSAFADILKAVVDRVPGAIGATFVDWEGEAVDQWGSVPALEMQLAGAHWSIVLNQAGNRLSPWGAVDEICIEGSSGLVLIRRVTEQYCIVVMARSGAHLAMLRRSVDRGVDGLRREM